MQYNEKAKAAGVNRTVGRQVYRDTFNCSKYTPVPVGGLKGGLRSYGSSVGILSTISYGISARDNYNKYSKDGLGTVYVADGIDGVGVAAGVLFDLSVPVDFPIIVVGGASVVFGYAASKFTDNVKNLLLGK